MTPHDGTPVTAEEVLLQAADAIAEHGHIKGRYGSPREGGFCAMGAMRHAVISDEMFFTSTVTREDRRDLYASAELLLGNSLNDGPDSYEMFYTSTATREDLRDLYASAELLLGNSLNDGPDPYSAIARFNDNPMTTGEDVILQMKKAAHHD